MGPLQGERRRSVDLQGTVRLQGEDLRAMGLQGEDPPDTDRLRVAASDLPVASVRVDR